MSALRSRRTGIVWCYCALIFSKICCPSESDDGKAFYLKIWEWKGFASEKIFLALRMCKLRLPIFKWWLNTRRTTSIPIDISSRLSENRSGFYETATGYPLAVIFGISPYSFQKIVTPPTQENISQNSPKSEEISAAHAHITILEYT